MIGRSSTWRTIRRTRSADSAEVAHRAGHPALLISYRNDDGAPRGDGMAKFGLDEWEDLEAAIAYAKTRGAADVILAAGSMGGAITLSLFEHGSAQARSVRALVLDSPALAIGRQTRFAAEAMGVPGLIAELGLVLTSWRFGLDWEAMDYLSAVDDVKVPMLVLTDRYIISTLTKTTTCEVHIQSDGTLVLTGLPPAELFGWAKS